MLLKIKKIQEEVKIPEGPIGPFITAARFPSCQHDYDLISDERKLMTIGQCGAYVRELKFYCRKCLDIQIKHILASD